MIILESENIMQNQGKSGDIMSKIYCVGEYLGMTKTQLKFKEYFYYIEKIEIENVFKDNPGEPDTVFIENQVRLKSLSDKSDEKFLPLRMKDFGAKPTAEETAYNQSTIQFLFNAFGIPIATTDNFPDKVEENFYTIFPAVQTNNAPWKVKKWVVKHLSY